MLKHVYNCETSSNLCKVFRNSQANIIFNFFAKDSFHSTLFIFNYLAFLHICTYSKLRVLLYICQKHFHKVKNIFCYILCRVES